MMVRNLKQLAMALTLLGVTIPSGFAFDDAKIIPKGVRRVTVHTVHMQFDSKTDSNKTATPLASRIERDVTVKDFINVRSGFAKEQLHSFALANDIDKNLSLGSFKADMRANVNVYAPTFAYGVTDKLNLGFALPIYDVSTSVDLAFHPNRNANKILKLLASPRTGQTGKVREAVQSINTVKEKFKQKLLDNGYEELNDWQESGVGDLLLKGKYQFMNIGRFSAANTFGAVAPTGRTDDPDNLTDIGFGDGTWDLFMGLNLDQQLGYGFFFNEYGQYTHQLPAKRKIRMRTEDEPIAVENEQVTYKLGDKVDAGASLQFDGEAGFQSGLGYVYFHKFKDNYKAGPETSPLYEVDTTETEHFAETFIGYSSINAFRKGNAAVPYSAMVTYLNQLQSQNRPQADQVQLDLKVYF